MDQRYQAFTLADRQVYQHPFYAVPTLYRLAPGVDWDNSSWEIEVTYEWVYVNFCGKALPDQGWKIHVSGCPDNAARILGVVSRYCNEHKISFKYLPNEAVLRVANDKYAPRGSSGKFITIYTPSESELPFILDDLDSELHGEKGPYILSDVRYKAGPLYVRYGGFAPRSMLGENDQLVPAFLGKDGETVPDHRTPYFNPPEWIKLPEVVVDCLTELGSVEPPEDLPYEITEAIHFSNTGGVFLARWKADGRTVVIKQARQHTGVDASGSDAVARLKHEAHVLGALNACQYTPQILDQRFIGEDYFIAEEHFEGMSILRLLPQISPNLQDDPSSDEISAFTKRALRISENLEALVRDIHKCGVFIGDLHAGNIIVIDGDHVRLVDLETAVLNGQDARSSLGVDGIAAPRSLSGWSADYYSLGCTLLNIYCPLTQLLNISSSTLDYIFRYIRSTYPDVSETYLARIRSWIVGSPKESHCSAYFQRKDIPAINSADLIAASGATLTSAVAKACVRRATFRSVDRLFPGDPATYWTNGYSFLYGASGIYSILKNELLDLRSAVLDWIENSLHTTVGSRSIGLLDGALGAAAILAKEGRREPFDLLTSELAQTHSFDKVSTSLSSGLAGWLYSSDLIIAKLSPNDDYYVLLDRIRKEIRRRAKQLLKTDLDPIPVHPQGTGGLLNGSVGWCLALVAEYGRDELDLLLAKELFDRELAYLETLPGGSYQLREETRVLPYLGTGSVGVGLVCKELIACDVVDAADMEPVLDGIRAAAKSQFVIQSGYLNGRAGLIAYLCLDQEPDSDIKSELERQIATFVPFMVGDLETGVDVIGDQLMRFSCDYATGSAGVAHAFNLYQRWLNRSTIGVRDLIFSLD